MYGAQRPCRCTGLNHFPTSFPAALPARIIRCAPNGAAGASSNQDKSHARAAGGVGEVGGKSGAEVGVSGDSLTRCNAVASKLCPVRSMHPPRGAAQRPPPRRRTRSNYYCHCYYTNIASRRRFRDCSYSPPSYTIQTVTASAASPARGARADAQKERRCATR
ncbi:hypothetical protein DFH09DRAFT_1161170 [Mycena vulgaris]|nr:hypothetical protein DFH09DRAFT_1161170 [Mycena vulgaris]